MVALNPAYFAEKETPSIGGRVGDFYRSRAQNRVGDFFSETSNRVGSNEPVTLIVTIEITVYSYETASGVHKYLYANANPAMYTDPSGNYSIGEFSLVNFVIGVLLPGVTPLRVGISALSATIDILTVTNIYRPAALGFAYFASDPAGVLFKDEQIGAEYFAELAIDKTFAVLAGATTRLYTIHLGLLANIGISSGINALGGDWRKSVPVLGTYVEVTEAVNFYNTTLGWLSSVSATGRGFAGGELDLSEASIGDLLNVARRIDSTIIQTYDSLAKSRK